MKISACIIVKDDSLLEELTNAVNSIKAWVDGIYITATGENVEKIKELCETSGYNIQYSYFKWCDDFSAARNFNFGQAPQDSDYIFWMDSDDILVGGESFRRLAELGQKTGQDIIFLEYWYGCTFKGKPTLKNMVDIEITQKRERLIRPGVITWKGRLHETPVPVSGAKNNYTSVKYTDTPQHEGEFSIAIMHTAQYEDLPAKMQRNKRILELQLEEERKTQGGADPRTLLYLMKIYAEEDDKEEWQKVLSMGEEYLTKSGWDEERGTCLELMGTVHGSLGFDQKAVDSYMMAIAAWPHSVLTYIKLATAYYNMKNYNAVKHWLGIASNMDLDKKLTSGATNYKGIKVMFAKLLINMNYHAERDTKKALEAATMLFKEDPSDANKAQLEFLQNLDSLNDACGFVDHLSEYLDSIGQGDKILPLLELLPTEITSQPFAHRIRQKVSRPRVWGKDEICYFANFGGKGFENWSAKNLETGIGGSETAVIELAHEWVAKGYKVTVYGDPGQDKGLDSAGVTWLPWYEFNSKDLFNIFIQWRSWALAGNIKARKFLVDLHDIYSAVDLKPDQLHNIDKIMVKSDYQRKLAPSIPDDKFVVISNGIRV